MYATALFALVAGASIAQAAPLEQRATPAHYAEGYLEAYDTYHSRYISIGCSGKQGTQFFDNCCRPLLATESVEANRPSYCASGYAAWAGQSSSAPAASSAAAAPASSSAAAAAVADAGAAYAQPSSKAAAPSPSTTTKAAEPTTTSQAAQQTQPAQSSGYQYKGGFATYFYQGGNAGACGIVHGDGELGIAIDGNGFWQNYGVTSEHCGKWINIRNTNNGKTVTAQVWDVCPTCTNDNSLDLSVGAFNAIASPSEGMVPIEWSFA